MKKKNFILMLLIAATLALFLGYRALDAIRTDTRAPEIRMDSVIPEISVEDPKTALLQGITAVDSGDGDVTSSLVVERVELLEDAGRLLVHYAAFDTAGNVAKAQREAKYTDYRSPRFTLKEPLVYRQGVAFDVLSDIGATDVIDGDIQHRVRATMLTEQAIVEPGVHEVEFRVSNSLGDTVTAVLPVEVRNPEREAQLTLSQYLLYLPVNGSFNAKDYLKMYTYGEDDVDLSKGLPRGYSLKTEGKVQTQKPGVYPVEYRVTYTIVNEQDRELDVEITGYSKLIVIVEG